MAGDPGQFPPLPPPLNPALTFGLLYEHAYCSRKIVKHVWKQAKLSVWKQNRSNAKPTNEKYLKICGGCNSQK